MKSTLLVSAQREYRNGVEYFHYVDAKMLHGSTTELKLRTQLENGYMDFEFRLHDNGTASGRNHGTAFRVKESNLEHIFGEIDQLSISINKTPHVPI